MATQSFTCRECQKEFSVREDVLTRYPGWQPAICLSCKDKSKGGQRRTKSGASSGRGKSFKRRPKKKAAEENLPVARVLERYSDGPFDGVFTDGACVGNPGPGGWGTVWVRGNEVVEQKHGHAERTTNNRMEMRALITAYEMLPGDSQETIWSDSNLCVRTINEWAAGWEKRGWRRKTGPVENLDLVKKAYALARAHPGVELRWIKAHNGSRWNEYADALATAFQREEL